MDHSNRFKYKLLPTQKQKPLPTQKGLNSAPKRGVMRANAREPTKVRFLFSSFIAADVKQSTTEFQTFLIKFSHLIHQRLWDTHLKLDTIKTSSQIHSKKTYSPTPNLSEPNSQLQMWLNPQKSESPSVCNMGKASPKQEARSAKPFSTNNRAKKMIWDMKSHGMVKTIHDHGSLKASNQFPQSTHLKTVIRSPHVFKKTREQFGMVKCIRSLDYYFQSNTSAQLFINCASVLKFPVEVQIQLSSRK